MPVLTAGLYLDSRFRLIRPIDEGEKVGVWLADDIESGGRVVVQILPTDFPEARIAALHRQCNDRSRGQNRTTASHFDSHRGSEFSYITMALSDGDDGGGTLATIVEQLRDMATEQGGGSPSETASKETVRLTPPPRVQPIRPITPRLARLDETAVPTGRNWGMLSAILGAAGLIAAGLIFFLSRDNPRPVLSSGDPATAKPTSDSSSHSPAGTTSAGEAPASPAESIAPLDDLRRRAYLKGQAEETAQRAKDLSESLRERGVTLWGDDRFGGALQDIADGDAQLADGEFDAAEEFYLSALGELETVEARSLDILREMLADGRSALATGDAIAAAAAFSLAARIDPSSRTAATGLRRAEVLDELNALLDSGVEQERIGDDAFAAEISAGLAALDQSDFKAAREAFRRAGALRPESQQVESGLIQAEEGEKLAAITAHRDRAFEMERAERWRDAEKEYDAILRLDPAIRIAGDGKERVAARAGLGEALAYHLDHPDRLSADEVFEEASSLRDRAASIAPAGPLLSGQVKALDALLAQMRNAVWVVLESDERTEVTIYRIGRLGTFSRHEVELRPGSYTIVGTRRGYRDVRHQLVIAPGKEPAVLVVRCEEKI